MWPLTYKTYCRDSTSARQLNTSELYGDDVAKNMKHEHEHLMKHIKKRVNKEQMGLVLDTKCKTEANVMEFSLAYPASTGLALFVVSAGVI